MQGALQELLLQPVLEPLREIANPGYYHYLMNARLRDAEAVLPATLLPEAVEKLSRLIHGIETQIGPSYNFV